MYSIVYAHAFDETNYRIVKIQFCSKDLKSPTIVLYKLSIVQEYELELQAMVRFFSNSS